MKLDNTGVCQSLTKQMGTGGNNVPLVMEPMPYRKTAHPRSEDMPQGWEPARVNDTLNSYDNGETRTPTVVVNCVAIEGNGARPSHQGNGYSEEDVGYTLNAVERHAVAYGIDKAAFNQGENAKFGFTVAKDVSTLLTANRPNAVCVDYIVRRLTPMECERLQGFPDGWTDIGTWTDTKGKKHETLDSARYQALGNSIALPFWRFLLRRISAEYLTPPTMCSLFDGIGGFPLIWESINGKGTAVWASEIEEFPMAVTRYHFGEDEQK